jgi:site-specific recombinase XerD
MSNRAHQRKYRKRLRHTFCTHLADVGTDVAVIRELGGHADIRTTTICSAVNDDRLESAIAGRYRDRGLAQLDRD